MDTSAGRVEGAEHGAEWFQTYLRSLEGQVNTTAMHQREQALAQKDVLLIESYESSFLGHGSPGRSQVTARVANGIARICTEAG